MSMRLYKKNIPDIEIFENSYKLHRGNPLMTLIGFYKGYFHNFCLSTFFYIIKHSPTWILPIATANIINYVTDSVPDAKRLILLNAAVLVILLLLNIPMNYLHMHFRASAVRDVEAGLRSTLVHKIQTMSILSEKDIQSGRLQSKIIRDVESIETLSDQIFVNFMNIIINVAVALAVTVSKSKVVFLFFLLMVPLAATLVYMFKKPIKAHNQRFRKEVEATSAKVSEMVELVPVTRAHALEEEEINRMNEQVRQIAVEGYHLDMIQTNFGAVSWACFQIFQVICLVFTAFLALRGVIKTGDVVLYQSYFTTIVGQVSSMLNLLPTISKGLESVNSIGEVLEVDDVEDNEGKTEIIDLRGEYEFDHVSYAYPKTDKLILHELSFKFTPGQTVAFVGATGAGKTTILSLIVRNYEIQKGQILIDDVDITHIKIKSLRAAIGQMLQDVFLFSGSIRDNITLHDTSYKDEEIMKVCEYVNADSFINKLPKKLDEEVIERGENFSQGQRQLLSFARTVLADPQILILDEATANIDTETEVLIQESLEKIKNIGTMLVVAHRLSTIQHADQIMVLQRGEILEHGNHQELLAKHGYYYKLYKLQFEGKN